MIRLAILLLAATPSSWSQAPAPKGVGVRSRFVSVGGGLVALLANERANGDVDLNGDGDVFDTVAMLWDADDDSLVNFGLAAGFPPNPTLGEPPVVTDGRFVVFSVDERAQSETDLNGDGDTGDQVLHVHDHRTQGIRNIGIAVAGQAVARFGGGRILFLAEEAGEGRDLNGDGDLLDHVAHELDPVSGNVANLGLAVSRGLLAHGSVGDTFAFLVPEVEQGVVDLNGDGDVLDHVLFLHRAGSPSPTNLGLSTALVITFDNYGFGPPPVVPGAPLHFKVHEESQGEDLNLDGDLDDHVLHLVDHETYQVTNTGLVATFVQVSPDRRHIAVDVVEQDLDLNDDGDTFDVVLHLYDVAAGTFTNLKVFAVFPRFTGGGSRASSRRARGDASSGIQSLLLLDAIEGFDSTQRTSHPFVGSGDLNGDGDAEDHVLMYYDLREGRIRPADLAVGDSRAGFPGSPATSALVAVRADEFGEGRDLNGDGDTEDLVVHVFDARTREVTNLASATFCCDGNILGAYIGAHGPHVVFPVHEASQGGTDLDGDGDALDHVLHTFDARTGELVNHGLAVDRLEIERDGGLFAFRDSRGAVFVLDLR